VPSTPGTSRAIFDSWIAAALVRSSEAAGGSVATATTKPWSSGGTRPVGRVLISPQTATSSTPKVAMTRSVWRAITDTEPM